MFISAITYKDLRKNYFTNSIVKKRKMEDNNNNLKNTTEKVNFSANFEYLHQKPRTLKKYTGCLLGGAIGDALGNPVEFLDIRTIKGTYGKNGITDLVVGTDGKAEITDDTQMTFFTADGLIKSFLNGSDKRKLPDMGVIYGSYLDWCKTQYSRFDFIKKDDKGWIFKLDELHHQRAPGMTCLGALENRIPGSIEKPINNSKGCGGVMRVAPAGLVYYKNSKLAFEVGARCAALTHGSPDAYLSAGVHAGIISEILQGKTLNEAVDNSLEILKGYKRSANLYNLIEKAKKLAQSDVEPQKAIKSLGEGWFGDEAIAIAIYCALKSPDDFKKALIMSVNHNGDSDSTGAITGNILGAYLGIDNIPADWKNKVELSKELRQLAFDLYVDTSKIRNSKNRYKL